ncbi:Stp1/IreP family PP2C-type Ser/Thr phosphatase [Thermobrachium celere]|uniref:Protein serine/threonine phosphatase PrpC, regulation of stationary phase n=1 Tax=Thermobrachium celere DSM 8682 TaxID=941824 RepID=R7RRA9_9CLOT|nr:Stp1/IreP family PP2C-type Ser/Thr phosphatase [Thermobrachium celere]GFR35066.1 protein phosphatase [Thermobrachium celere]CDF57891.1 Protein serine/threonine phosphatase PrpC, regulation of stationary phase [Thermobrachium celere DSM 8682]
MYIFCKTDIGKKRELNEDYVLVFKSPNYQLLIVADGMGGHNGGEVASEIAATSIRQYIFDNFSNTEDKTELLRDAIVFANKEVYRISQQNNKLSGMGTTVTCCLLIGNRAIVGHVGDSRAYRITKDYIIKVTEDHSFVQQLINKGTITQEEAANHPQKNVITRAIGVDEYVIVDIIDFELKDDETILLCTDGLTNYISEGEIKDIVLNESDPVRVLIDKANERGGADNISVIVAQKEVGK